MCWYFKKRGIKREIIENESERKTDGIFELVGREKQHEKESGVESKGSGSKMGINGVRLWTTQKLRERT